MRIRAALLGALSFARPSFGATMDALHPHEQPAECFRNRPFGTRRGSGPSAGSAAKQAAVDRRFSGRFRRFIVGLDAAISERSIECDGWLLYSRLSADGAYSRIVFKAHSPANIAKENLYGRPRSYRS
jgi:hypothetical protein